jgi:chemotaxis protein MotB
MASKWEKRSMKSRSSFQLQTPKEAIWMLSFSDMILSLLCFFLLLLSFSHKKNDSTSAAQPASTVNSSSTTGVASTIAATHPSSDLSQLAATLRRILEEKKLDSLLHVNLDASGLHIEFTDGLLFDPTDARPNPQYKEAISEITSIIAPFTAQHRIKIEGHTDDTPLLPGGVFASNWELSSARGLSFLHLFLQYGVRDEDISVMAYAHTHPKIPYKGLTGGALQAARNANRRVVLWLE